MLTFTVALATAGGTVDALASTEESGSDDMRTVDGAYGPVEIPADPQRIVADLMTLDYLTALGVDTSRIVALFGADFFPDDHYLADELNRDALVDPGFAFEANLELVASVDPDLILVPFDQIDGAPGLGEMEAIAPVLVVPTSETDDPAIRFGGSASFQDWRTTLRSFGSLLELDAEAETYIAATEEILANVRQEHGNLIDSITATEMKSTPDSIAVNVLSAALDSGVLGTILMSELGFSPPALLAEVDTDDYGLVELSHENLGLVDSDILFVEVREGSTAHIESPLWETLEVVRRGDVFEVGNHWEFGGAVAARQVLADIGEALDSYAERH